MSARDDAAAGYTKFSEQREIYLEQKPWMRCKALTNGRHGQERRPCRRLRHPGHEYCIPHLKFGGRVKKFGTPREYRDERPAEFDLLSTIPMVYSKYLSDTIKQRMLELAAHPVQETLDFTEELALAQCTLTDAARMYDVTCQLGEKCDSGNALKLLEARLAAGQVLREVISQTFDLVSKAQQMRGAARDQVSVQNIHLVLQQVVRSAYEIMGDDHVDLAQQLAQRIEQIRLPREGDDRTSLTPDEEARLMDATIPAQPESRELTVHSEHLDESEVA